MAKFAKLTGAFDGLPNYVGVEHVTNFYTDEVPKIRGKVVKIHFDAPYGDTSDYVYVRESLDEVARALSVGSGAAEQESLLPWEVSDEKGEPYGYGIFGRRYVCPYCRTPNSYGQSPFCLYCGHQVRVIEAKKEEQDETTV